ncbi:MAG: Mitochondrial import receptor subunit TOM40B [Marteilia pararefringens]
MSSDDGAATSQQQQSSTDLSTGSSITGVKSPIDTKFQTVEEILRQFRNLRPEFSSGASLRIVRPLSNHLQTCHTLNIPENIQEGSYSYGATYVGKILNDSEAFPILNGEISPSSGNFNSVFIHKFSDNIIGRLNGSFGYGKWLASHMALDYQKPDRALSIFIDKLNPFVPRGTICIQYMQSVRRNLSLGFDYQIHQNETAVPQTAPATDTNRSQISRIHKLSLLSLLRTTHFDTLVNLSNKSPHLSLNFSSQILNQYLQDRNADLTLTSNLDFASKAELMSMGPMAPSSLSLGSKFALFADIGYVLKLRQNGCIFKTSVRSDGTIVSNADYPINGIPMTFGICASINPLTSKFNTGFRISIGQ